jgi:hypothetical protein
VYELFFERKQNNNIFGVQLDQAILYLNNNNNIIKVQEIVSL